MANRLVWVLKDIQGLSPLQFWVRRFRSTADPLLRVEYDISVAFVLAVFFDFHKVYDTKWKRGVLRNLFSLVFFVEIYLSLVNRTFRVRVGDTLSLSFDQVEGVLQGSALNVHCFALAINSIVTAHPDGVS